MASAAAQIHALGANPISSRSNNPTQKHLKTVFFGQRMNNTVSFINPKSSFVKLKRSRRNSGKNSPFRVVAEKMVGIDLGTTNSTEGAMEGGKSVIVTNAEGQRTTPSVVAYTKNGDRLVGQIAKMQAVVNPKNTFFSVKRFIGRKMSEVDEESKLVSYTVVRDDNGNVKLDCPAIGKQFAAEESSAQIELKTAPADYRLPTTNQSKHCFTRYIEFHRCIAAKGDESAECEKFAKYYRSLCPGEWLIAHL